MKTAIMKCSVGRQDILLMLNNVRNEFSETPCDIQLFFE